MKSELVKQGKGIPVSTETQIPIRFTEPPYGFEEEHETLKKLSTKWMEEA